MNLIGTYFESPQYSDYKDLVDEMLHEFGEDEVSLKLVAFLKTGDVKYYYWSKFQVLSKSLSFSEHQVHQLNLIVKDKQASLANRRFVFSVLAALLGDEFLESLFNWSEEQLTLLKDGESVGMISSIINGDADPDLVTELFLMIKAKRVVPSIIESMGRARKELGVPAYIIYGDALLNSKVSFIHKVFLKAIEKDNDFLALNLLEAYIARTKIKDMKTFAQKIVLKLRTSMMNVNAGDISGTVKLSNVDLNGTFVMILVFEFREHFYNVKLGCRCDEGVTDAFIVNGIGINDLDYEISLYDSSDTLNFLTSDIHEVSGLIKYILDSTEGSDLNEESLATVDFLRIFFAESVPENFAEMYDNFTPVKGDKFKKGLNEMLNRKLFKSWSITRGDFAAIDDNFHFYKDITGKTAKDFVIKPSSDTDKLLVMIRMKNMFEMMAVWFKYKGDIKDYNLLLSALAEKKEGFSSTLLAKKQLKNQIKIYLKNRSSDNTGDKIIGDPVVRDILKDIIDSSGKTKILRRHMAWLDLSEVIFFEINSVYNELFSLEQMPAEKVTANLSLELAKIFTDVFSKQDILDNNADMESRMLAIFEEYNIFNQDEIKYVMFNLGTEVYGFVQEVCNMCPLHCFDKISKNAEEEFYSPMHPGMQFD